MRGNTRSAARPAYDPYLFEPEHPKPRTIATAPPPLPSRSRRHAMTLPSDSEIAIYKSLGAAFIGFAVSCCLYGILLSQIFAYYMRYQQDKLLYKYLVSVKSISGRRRCSSFDKVVVLGWARLVIMPHAIENGFSQNIRDIGPNFHRACGVLVWNKELCKSTCP